MIVARGENYKIEIYHLKENSPYEWEDTPFVVCYGRPANKIEKRSYRLQKGVNTSTDSTYILCSNLPDAVKDGDKIVFMGKHWTIESVGFFFDDARFVNARVFDEEYLAKKCPKGMAVV